MHLPTQPPDTSHRASCADGGPKPATRGRVRQAVPRSDPRPVAQKLHSDRTQVLLALDADPTPIPPGRHPQTLIRLCRGRR